MIKRTTIWQSIGFISALTGAILGGLLTALGFFLQNKIALASLEKTAKMKLSARFEDFLSLLKEWNAGHFSAEPDLPQWITNTTHAEWSEYIATQPYRKIKERLSKRRMGIIPPLSNDEIDTFLKSLPYI